MNGTTGNRPGEYDEQVARLAAGSSNFGHLLRHEPLLVTLGCSAESYVHTDPHAAMVKARLFGEVMARHLVTLLGVTVPGNRQVDRINALVRAEVLVPQVRAWFEAIRETGNRAVHEYYANVREALRCVETCFRLGDWLHRASDPSDTAHRVFLAPAPPSAAPAPATAADLRELEQLRTELDAYRRRLEEARLRYDGRQSRLERERAAREQAEAELARAEAERAALHDLIAELSEKLTELAAPDVESRSAARPLDGASRRDEFIAYAQKAARPPMSEAQVRAELDRMLELAGWTVQDDGAKNLFAGRGVAVREVSTAVGRADYLLYVDQRLVGVVEAKREGADLEAAMRQAARYATGLTRSQQLSAWRASLPFRYVADGNTVRFHNALDPSPRTREVFAVHRPETVARWIEEAEADPAAPTLRARLRRLPGTFLDPAPLRPAQLTAITGLERSLAKDDPRALIQMATGAGKTYTVVSETYRLLRHAGARRVLFLVDRNNLGGQAATEFENFDTPDDGRKFTELYVVQRLAGDTVLGSAHVVVSTVQRLWMALTGRDVPSADKEDAALDRYDLVKEPVQVGYNPDLPPEAFDLVVVDECHRSIYGKWRAVLEYFDAHLVGLTATPVKQTFGFFFQNLVSEYPYEQAVADRVNVDFDVFRIRTELGENGGTIPAETVVPMRERRTRRERYQELEEDLEWKASQLGRQVISKGQLKLVLETFREHLFTDIFPPVGEGEARRARTHVPKTLVFAVDDNHADEIVGMVRQVFGESDDFCQKITHAAKRPAELIKAFRNSPELRIAVTVDMIATGTDIPPLECVFFLRDVKSWAYFEQMKGRGSRTVDPAEFQAVTPDAEVKERFVIVDAVGVTDSPRVDARPLNRISERKIPLERLMAKTAGLAMTEDEIATLAGRLARLDQQLTAEEREEVAELAGLPLREIVGGLVRSVDPDQQERARRIGGEERVRRNMLDALKPIAANRELRDRLMSMRRAHDIVIDEVSVDEVREVRGITPDELAMRRVTSWKQYLDEHRDETTAFEIAFRDRRDPKEVYRRLKDLARKIERPPFQWTPARLYDAYVQLGKAARHPGGSAGVVDLIGLLRFELGLDEEVRPYRALVEERYAAWRARQEQAGAVFTEEQTWWLDRMVDVIATDAAIEPAHLKGLPFNERGGVDGFLREFGPDRAAEILDELGRELGA
ncbi:DEAD/DEAH box helicase family protein [Streptomyces somaliensis DSM 40738]|uniref:DEAD/DEAH box helicase family protein n=1 Tax=Streptomyces somaliensis (strain ATCC 33201 / DSM 40738 / JCM 12659 / KCTC 9044 / NCTC 11332 / NRRL B-12077 / IP 733) TaxID=1134445 RepID=A0AA44IBF1_STRE0|nr:DEAD/DEAH box helicase family protein [Streptomyces somaliensis]MCQ0024347.1 DEAD/DEAH box helicase family protein [Streptomyces somaliensis DSM 40738]NKY12666.1 DEAD/DEAH box helicase family protein [Streptomyces somaliensis DSM 40738]